MKLRPIYIVIAIAMLNLACQDIESNSDNGTHTFYKNYSVSLPADNYIVISMRAFVQNNYLVLDMNANNLRIYSPYESKGLLFHRELSNAEVVSILEIFDSKEYLAIPGMNVKTAMDAEEIDIQSVIKNREKHIYHIMPDDKIIRRIIDLYNRFNIIPKK